MEESKSYFYNFIPIISEVTQQERKKILEKYPPPELPTSGEFFNIQNEAVGNIVNIRVLLNEFSVQTTRTNKHYLKIIFSNNLGNINAKMWDNHGDIEKYITLLEEYSVFHVEAKVDEYLGHKSLTINRLVPCDENINPFYLLAYTQQDMEELTVELFSYLYQLQSPYKEISLAAMDQFWDQFRIRPAAKGYHHNYLGGLLKHTVGLMRFARFILKFEENHFQAVMKLINVVEKAHKRELWDQFQSDDNSQNLVWNNTIDHLYRMLSGMMQYKNNTPNYDALMTSILFHDIGKLLEYDHAGKKYEEFKYLFPTATDSNFATRKQTGITMDELGVMIGHIPYGVLLLTKVIENEKIQVSLEDIHLMSHCILCHHGLPEWGSAIRNPQTIEGYIIHIVDFLDSRYENTELIK
ncbi:HD domain-containing protein [Pallidibacillus thermolactis]|jgi:3'-5' exoribonuclease|uniref:HD domain-containing protein n=1 Tax=Pallidibacillus thermolactis TaxID=251051 RepID=UPI0021D9A717|nr:HD domain-containing protein [Pallidibacillus thermolactis]MCU9602532.1 HD domain-containing protein [Pallidibacillus thermolactis subsp. kokeshiiformis]